MHKRYQRKKGDDQRHKLSDALAVTILGIMTDAELRVLKRNINVLLAEPNRKVRC